MKVTETCGKTANKRPNMQDIPIGVPLKALSRGHDNIYMRVNNTPTGQIQMLDVTTNMVTTNWTGSAPFTTGDLEFFPDAVLVLKPETK